MGILDDAIREHLELIRRRGEPESELQRLEDEAFGPPTRPDEADFPESQEAEAPSGNGAAAEADLHDEAATEGPAVGNEDVTRMIPAAGASEAPPAAEEGAAEQESIEAQEIEEEPDYEGELPAEEPEDESVAGVHPIVESAEDQDEPPSDEVAVAPEEATSLYDQSADDAPDFNDLNLELEEAAPAAEPPSEEHELHEPAGAIPLEPPIESLDTVEHAFPEEIVESEEGVEESDQAAEEQAEAALPAHEDDEKRHKDEEGAEDEDVLADTPEFLKDAPEDDELWFEQGEPKDFDF